MPPAMLDDVHKELLSSLAKAHDALRRDLAKLRAGRANPDLLSSIRVDYYGTPTPLAQMANVSVPEARLLTVKPWDKTAMKAVEKAIRESQLGLNPLVDGDIIRVPLPPLTEERRREFVKIVRDKAEQAKVAVRNIRRKAKDDLDALKSEVGDDDVARGEKELEQVTKAHIDAIDDALKRKEAELLEV